MKIINETSLRNFDFWSGARTTADTLWEKIGGSAFDTIESILEECYPEGITDTQINDIFWFEEDWLADILGYESWEQLENEGDE